ncbi:MAG TPA: serine/threonine-protein kinase [Anaerolineales bacterium]|nr:serine/threonine-protein kinase [Anaerolineales bacterium]
MQPVKIGLYEIKSELGRGGMATVYRAYDPRFEREVAVKVLPRELLHADPQFRLRFEREAKIIAQLEHTAIVPVYDVGEADGQPYFVMRYMNGGSLSDRIKAGVMEVEEAARILGAIAPGLDEAHARGIVHRDIKPSNILFDKRGNPYISDFGIAKLSQAQSGNVTGSAIIGTPAYMAPEQAQGDDIDGRADIYALGIILFEMVTGKQPYEADTPMAVAIKHITDPVPHILDANPKLPFGMDAIIQKAMAKNRNDRYSTAVELVNALRDLGRSVPTQMQTKVPAFQKETVVRQRAVIQPKRAFSPMLVIVPAVVMAALAGGFFVFNGRSNQVPTDAPVTAAATSAPAFTETSIPTRLPTQTSIPVTPTNAPPTPTETPSAPLLPVLGGADKIAFVANNEVWLMNADGSDLRQLTTDGAAKNDLQWIDADTLLFLSGKIIKYYKLDTDSVETLTSFPSAVSLDAFQVSHDRSQVIIAMSNEVFVVPFDFETLASINTRGNLFGMEGVCILPTGKTKAALQVQEARWSADDTLVAWLFKGVDAGNSSLQAEQVSVLDISACVPETIDLLDNFPGTRFNPVGFQNREMPDFDWDGADLFVFNTSRRNNGWGELYLYNWKTHRANLLNPIEGKCCYRDARWSPDSTYLLFAFQDFGLGAEAPTLLYYVPSGELGTGANFNPLPLEPGFFRDPKEAPQAALRPAE